jgi:hypothetical protein
MTFAPGDLLVKEHAGRVVTRRVIDVVRNDRLEVTHYVLQVAGLDGSRRRAKRIERVIAAVVEFEYVCEVTL